MDGQSSLSLKPEGLGLKKKVVNVDELKNFGRDGKSAQSPIGNNERLNEEERLWMSS